MIKAKRLGHATFVTPDIERQIDYWTNVVGLCVVERDRTRAFLATRLGEEAIALQHGAVAQMTRMSFQVAPGSDLGELAAKVATIGIKSERRQDISPGVSDAIVFEDPNGILLEIYADYRFHKHDKGDGGISPIKLGHVAYRVRDVQQVVSFYNDVLGFRTSDWQGDWFAFLRCGVDHHTLNFVRYDDPALHHIAFEVKDWAELHRSFNILHRHNIHLVWGPGRHVIGHNVAAYHRDPDQHRIEMFCEMDLMMDEELGYWEPRPWHEEVPLRPKVWPSDTLRSAWGFGSFGTFPGST